MNIVQSLAGPGNSEYVEATLEVSSNNIQIVVDGMKSSVPGITPELVALFQEIGDAFPCQVRTVSMPVTVQIEGMGAVNSGTTFPFFKVQIPLSHDLIKLANKKDPMGNPYLSLGLQGGDLQTLETLVYANVMSQLEGPKDEDYPED